ARCRQCSAVSFVELITMNVQHPRGRHGSDLRPVTLKMRFSVAAQPIAPSSHNPEQSLASSHARWAQSFPQQRPPALQPQGRANAPLRLCWMTSSPASPLYFEAYNAGFVENVPSKEKL